MEEIIINCEDTPYRIQCRSRWSALIRKVYEVDPLKCPECGGEMKIVSFIEKKEQAVVVEKILTIFALNALKCYCSGTFITKGKIKIPIIFYC